MTPNEHDVPHTQDEVPIQPNEYHERIEELGAIDSVEADIERVQNASPQVNSELNGSPSVGDAPVKKSHKKGIIIGGIVTVLMLCGLGGAAATYAMSTPLKNEYTEGLAVYDEIMRSLKEGQEDLLEEGSLLDLSQERQPRQEFYETFAGKLDEFAQLDVMRDEVVAEAYRVARVEFDGVSGEMTDLLDSAPKLVEMQAACDAGFPAFQTAVAAAKTTDEYLSAFDDSMIDCVQSAGELREAESRIVGRYANGLYQTMAKMRLHYQQGVTAQAEEEMLAQMKEFDRTAESLEDVSDAFDDEIDALEARQEISDDLAKIKAALEAGQKRALL